MEALAKGRKKRGLSTEMWDDAPEVFSDLAWVWDGFQQLSLTRPSGFSGPGPIPGTEIQVWLDNNYIDSTDERIFFDHAIRMMDQVYRSKTDETKKDE